MTVLTSREIRDQFKISKKEIDSYFKRHPRLKRTDANVRKVRELLAIEKGQRQPGKEISFTQAAAERQIIYGETRVGGVITFVAESGDTHEFHHMVITLAGHEISSIQKLYLDEQEVIFSGPTASGWSTGIRRDDGSIITATNRVFISTTYGTTGQSTNSDLNTNLPSLWTAQHIQDGCAYAYIILKNDPVLFPNGVPDVTFLVRGKPCKLPDNSTAFTSNAAAIAVDFLTSPAPVGMGIAWANIDTTTYTSAYNKCNENVGIIGGGTEKRYTVDGAFKTSETPRSILATICSSMAGIVVPIGDKFKIYAGEYRSPTLTLTEDDILSDIQVQTRFSRRESFNGVRGTFVSEVDNFEETDFPAVTNEYYKTLDGGERVWVDVQYSCVKSAAKAQRLAKIELERNRQSITVQLKAKLGAYQLEPMDTVMLTLSRMGWSSKVFEVQHVALDFGQDSDGTPGITTSLMLRETASAVFDWNDGSESTYDLARNTNLPNPLSTPVITGVSLSSGTSELYIRSDGTVFSRIKVSWTAISDYYISSGGKVQIQYKKSADSTWNTAGTVDGDLTSFYILDVHDGVLYDVRVRAVNGLGIAGSWTTQTNYLVVGKSAAPSNVTSVSASIEQFGIRVTWLPVADLDVKTYEVRIGASGSTWDTATSLDIINGTSYLANIRTGDTYTFFVKAIDTSGHYSATAGYVIASIAVPESPNVSASIAANKYILSWNVPTSLYAIDFYEIAYGTPSTPYASRTVIGTTKGTRFESDVAWIDNRVFWITAFDVAGNAGDNGATSLTVIAPSVAQNLSADVIDNNVLLKWSAPALGTLSIDHYDIYKGSTFATSDLIGSTAGTFNAIFETVGGTFTYWVVPVDINGNEGPESGLSALVNQPPDFTLVSSQIIDPATITTLVNTQVDGDYVVGPINTTQTYQQHFDTNSWSTPQAQVSAGYPYYIEPSVTYGFIEKVIDYGTTITGCLVAVSWLQEIIDTAVDVKCSIGYSADGVTYMTQTDVTQVYATSFRYVKIRIGFGTAPVSGSPSGLSLILTGA